MNMRDENMQLKRLFPRIQDVDMPLRRWAFISRDASRTTFVTQHGYHHVYQALPMLALGMSATPDGKRRMLHQMLAKPLNTRHMTHGFLKPPTQSDSNGWRVYPWGEEDALPTSS